MFRWSLTGDSRENLDTDTSATSSIGVIRIGSILPHETTWIRYMNNKGKKKVFITLNITRQRPGITDRWKMNKKVTPVHCRELWHGRGKPGGFPELRWWSWVQETYRARPHSSECWRGKNCTVETTTLRVLTLKYSTDHWSAQAHEGITLAWGQTTWKN